MNAKQKSRAVYTAAALLILFIIGYNIWSYYAGYCTASTLMAFSLPAKLLLSGIAVAGLYLLSCKAKNKHLRQQSTCACGAALRTNWGYCPVCSRQRPVH